MSTRSNAQSFFEALVHTPHTLCGLKLKPLCILHLLWLEQIKSPLLSNDRRVTLKDLEVAAAICSSSDAEGILRILEKPPLFFHWRNQFRKVEDEARAWLAYYNDYFALPEFWESKGSGASQFPWLLLCFTSLVRETGWSREEVLRLPIGEAVWMNLCMGYLNSGETNVIGDTERLAMSPALTAEG